MADITDNAQAIEGRDAHDSPITENPVVIGGVTQDMDDTAPPNQVGAEDDVAQIAVDRDGAIFAHPHPPRIWSVSAEHTAQRTDFTVKAAPGAGLSLYITDIYVACNGVVTVTLEEGTTTLKFRYYGNGAGDGVALRLNTPIKLAANTLLSVTTSAAVTVTVVVSGYTAP